MKGSDVLEELMAGNRRYTAGEITQHTYNQETLAKLAESQHPIAAVIACSDSRVVPERIFDQPLGSLFVSRVPGNVASDGTKWMIDIAVGEFKVPLILVLAHTGCLAVKQIVEGIDGPGGMLRYRVQSAFHDAAMKGRDNLYERTIDQNARKTVQDLIAESHMLSDAVREGRIDIRSARYDMPTGQVILL